MAHLLFVPEGDHPSFFLWGTASPSSTPAHRIEQALAAKGEPREVWVAGTTGASARRKGVSIRLLHGIAALAAVPMEQVSDLPGSFGAWSAASKLALELASRGRFVPRVRSRGDAASGAAWEARWEVSLADRRDADRFEVIARAMPAAAHVTPLGAARAGNRQRTQKTPVWPKDALLYAFLSAAIDALVRESVALRIASSDGVDAQANRSKCLHQQVDSSIPWELRWIFALVSEGAALHFEAPEEQGLPDKLAAWASPAFVAGEGGAGQVESRVRVRMRLGGGGPSAGAARDRAGEGERIDLSGALRFRWEVELDGAALRPEEVRTLFREQGSPGAAAAPFFNTKGPLAGADEAALGASLRLAAQGGGLLPARAALRALLMGRVDWPGLPMPAEVAADGALSACFESLVGQGEGLAPEVSVALPRSERGLAWLTRRVSLGLGGWFVDEDEQARRLAATALLLFVERRKLDEISPKSVGLRKRAEPPPLVISADPVAWEAAIARAAPPLVPALHFGPLRAQSAVELNARAAGRGLVLTRYEELARAADLLGALEWPLILFDEADTQASSTSAWFKGAQGLRARCRIGLAGTAMDRRHSVAQAGFWDALELVSPGLLGSLETFRREIAVPVERFRDPDAERLMAKVVRLFVFRAGEPESAAGSPVPVGEASAREEAGR